MYGSVTKDNRPIPNEMHTPDTNAAHGQGGADQEIPELLSEDSRKRVIEWTYQLYKPAIAVRR